MLGYYLGVRISECFGLMWSDVDWETYTIRIERQLLMESPHRVLSQCKTTTARRTIDIPDSMKSWAVKIEKELGIHFKYHNLRHTHASNLAACNTPIPKLKHRLGHTKIETTTKYYIGETEVARDKLKEALGML